MYGWSHVSTNCEIRSATELDTIDVFFMYFL